MNKESLSRFELKGRVIVITGGAGLLLGSCMLNLLPTPILVDLNGESAEKSATYISKNFSVSALGVKTDITNKTDVEILYNTVFNKFGRIDGLINNAANNPQMERSQKKRSGADSKTFP